VAGGLLEGADVFAESCGGGFNGWRFLDFGDERGPDNGCIGEAAENGHMARERDAEADGDW
jgi:hypothetical protein